MIVKFKIKGTCVDDLFHILASNGYQVQLSTTQEKDTYICDVIVEDLKDESEEK
jgi:hypothetical protein